MALVIADRVRETSTTTGTGTYTLAGAETGFRTFSGAIGNTNTTPYVAVMGSNWEVGIGTVGAGTLARTTILASSNAGSAVSWASGTKQIGCSVAAGLLPLLQGSNIFVGNQTVQNSGGDVSLEVRADGDFTPRISWRKANVSGHTARLWQSRVNTGGAWTLRDDTIAIDRMLIDTSGRVLPGVNNTQDLGSTSLRWQDLFLSGVIGIDSFANSELGIECSGDTQPSIKLTKKAVSAHTARIWKIRVNADGQLAVRDDTAGQDRFLVGLSGGWKPAVDNSYQLGGPSERWTIVYAANGTINTSDAREKRDIHDAELGLAFVERLRPRRYRWRAGHDEREHYGLIAQELLEALGEVEFGGLEHDAESDRYGLNYAELVPVLIKAVQELSARVQQLEEKLA